jgi:hypothetical protein
MCNRKMYIAAIAKYHAALFLFVLSCKETLLKKNISFEDVLRFILVINENHCSQNLCSSTNALFNHSTYLLTPWSRVLHE